MTKIPLIDALRSCLRTFASAVGGNVAIIFTFAMIPVVGAVGAGVDYSSVSSARSAMQAAADSTALMLAKDAASLSTSQLQQSANDYFRATFNRPDAQNIKVTAVSDAQDASVTVSAGGSIKTNFTGIIGVSSLNFSARAVAVSYGIPGCVLALNTKASGAASANGNAAVTLDGCTLYDNSSNPTALMVGGSAQLSALSVSVVGGVSGSINITTTEGIKTNAAPTSDPYASVPLPAFSGCNHTNFTVDTVASIYPGVYCGGIEVNSGANVTFRPGIYFIDRGTFSVKGNATITGTGVTLVLTSSTGSNWPTAEINGGATVNLTPPSTGSTAGIVIFGDRKIPLGTSFKFTGGPSQYLGGAIYLPTAAVSFFGGVSTSTSCTQIIVDTISWTGNSKATINCGAFGTKTIGTVGVRLVS